MIRALRPTAPALALLPALALVPVLIVVLQAVHGGGSEIWAAFLLGAVRPSLDPVLIGSLLRALQDPRAGGGSEIWAALLHSWYGYSRVTISSRHMPKA